jgi:cytochrome bd-type quinol oxidase subunit 2
MNIDAAIIYALTVMDTTTELAGILGIFGAVVAAFCYATSWMALDNRDREQHDAAKKAGSWVGRFAACSLLLAAVTPSTNSLVRAYTLVEGVKVVNAEDIDAAVAGAAERADKLIEALESRGTAE